MKIALDFDGTYTLDPGLWHNFVTEALRRGHEIKIITSRKPEMMIETLPSYLEIIYTSNISKREYCDSINWQPDIWIDDTPELIVRPDFQEYLKVFNPESTKCEVEEESKREPNLSET